MCETLFRHGNFLLLYPTKIGSNNHWSEQIFQFGNIWRLSFLDRGLSFCAAGRCGERDNHCRGERCKHEHLHIQRCFNFVLFSLRSSNSFIPPPLFFGLQTLFLCKQTRTADEFKRLTANNKHRFHTHTGHLNDVRSTNKHLSFTHTRLCTSDLHQVLFFSLVRASASSSSSRSTSDSHESGLYEFSGFSRTVLRNDRGNKSFSQTTTWRRQQRLV